MVVHRHDLRDTLSKLCSLLVTDRKHRVGMNNAKARRKAAAQANGLAEIKLPATPDQLSATTAPGAAPEKSAASAAPNPPS
jgi:hypothetical protein